MPDDATDDTKPSESHEERAIRFCKEHHCIGQITRDASTSGNVRDLAAEFAAVDREAREAAWIQFRLATMPDDEVRAWNERIRIPAEAKEVMSRSVQRRVAAMKGEPVPVFDGTTHWEGCEQSHHKCALIWLERDRSLLSQARSWLANVSGALVDSGVDVPDESGYGEAVRKIVAERDALRRELKMLGRASAKSIVAATRRAEAAEKERDEAGKMLGEEAMWHAACLSIAERAPGWDQPFPDERPAQGAVRKVVERAIELEGALRDMVNLAGWDEDKGFRDLSEMPPGPDVHYEACAEARRVLGSDK